MKELSKTPRLFVEDPLEPEVSVTLSKQQSHYIYTVLRLKKGEHLRLFNGSNGEFLALLLEEKSKVHILSSLRSQDHKEGPWLFFTPLKKDRMDFLIEKAVELGVGKLSPILTDRTVVRKFHAERALAQCIEACEQSERLEIPHITSLSPLRKIFDSLPPHLTLYLCEERNQTLPNFADLKESNPCAILIGPEGGLTPEEKTWLTSHPRVVPVSLSENVLRSETAALCALSQIQTAPKNLALLKSR